MLTSDVKSGLWALTGFIYVYPEKEYTQSQLSAELIPVKSLPERVALLLNEESFYAMRGQLVHNKNCFLLSSIHDWNTVEKDGKFFIRISGNNDPEHPLPVIVCYSVEIGNLV